MACRISVYRWSDPSIVNTFSNCRLQEKFSQTRLFVETGWWRFSGLVVRRPLIASRRVANGFCRSLFYDRWCWWRNCCCCSNRPPNERDDTGINSLCHYPSLTLAVSATKYLPWRTSFSRVPVVVQAKQLQLVSRLDRRLGYRWETVDPLIRRISI